MQKTRLTHKQVANILGVTKKTLYNWEKAAKIPEPRRDPMNNYRYYTTKDIKRLKEITQR